MIKPQNREPVLGRRTAATAAFFIVGALSPFGMKAMDYFGVKASLSDIILSTAMFLTMLMVYHLVRGSSFRGTRGE